MDDDTEGLKRLIKQRHQRPCYSRTVSLEFSRSERSRPAPQRKQKKSKKITKETTEETSSHSERSPDESEIDIEDLITDSFQNEGTGIHQNENQACSERVGTDSSSEESEYFSADDDTNFESNSEGSTSQVPDDLSELDYLLYSDADNSNSDSESDSAFCSVNSSEYGDTSSRHEHLQKIQPVQRKRAPSKKQKRKRRYNNVVFLNDLPFSGLDSFECISSDLKCEITENADEIMVLKSVPSLSDLCIFAARQLGMKTSQNPLPGQIKKLLHHSNTKTSLQKFQLSWLYRLLSLCELDNVFENSYLYTKNDDVKTLLIPTRNIWESKINWCKLYDRQVYNGCRATSYIPFTYCSHDRGYTDYNEWTWDKYMTSRNCMAAYASTVDLMLPPMVKISTTRKKGPSGKSVQEDDGCSQMVENLIQRMEAVLKQRFPTTTKHYFHLVLPYVFWARGDVGHAANAFTCLAEKENRSRIKAMYLYEIGRMYAQFDEPVKAKSCFRLASEAASSKVKNILVDERINEINKQTLLLTANAYDQGLLTQEKAVQAASYWKAGVTYVKPETLTCICCSSWLYMDSFLCYHAWSWHVDGKTSWLEEAKTRVQSLTKSHPELYFYLSMVHALEGNLEESSNAYKCFLYGGGTSEGSSAPGSFMLGLTPPKTIPRTPWKVLSELIKDSDNVQPLQVVWRTQLGPLRVVDKTYLWESDMHSRDLNLRLSSEGYITGDMQMALPPVRGVYLDPYTGQLCFPHIPGDTEPWLGLQTDPYLENITYPDKSGKSILVVPTPSELYRDGLGNVVHLMCPSMDQAMMENDHRLNARHLMLLWTGADGQKARYNLLTKLRKIAFDDFINSTSDPKTKEEKSVPNWKEKVTKVAQYCLLKRLQFDSHRIKYQIVQNWGKKKKTQLAKNRTAKSAKNKKDKQKVKKPYIGYNTFVLEVGQHVVFGTNILLRLKMDNTFYLVFVDCRGKTEFLNPVILRHNDGNLMNIKDRTFQDVLKRNRLPHSDVVCCEDNGRNYVIYDKFGEEFDRVPGTDIHRDDGASNLPVIVNGTKTCFLDNKSLRSFCNGEEMWGEHLGPTEKLRNINNILILLTENSVKFVNGLTFLPLYILCDSKRSLSVPISEDSLELMGTLKFTYFAVLDERTLIDSNSKEKHTQAVLAIDNHLIVFKFSNHDDVEVLTILLSIALPGHAKESCFIGERTGLLVSVTQHTSSTIQYRENLYYIDYSGKLQGYVLCLGMGPRSFLPLYLPGNSELVEGKPGFGQSGWYVYMRDGQDGIIAVYLHS